MKFKFDGDCLRAFNYIKELLMSAPIIVALNWSMPLEVMYDVSGVATGAVLGHTREKLIQLFCYASKSLNDA